MDLKKITTIYYPEITLIQHNEHKLACGEYSKLCSEIKNPQKDQDFPEAVISITPTPEKDYHVGILGGMGPLATLGMIELFEKFAPKLNIIVLMASKIPDRNTALRSASKDRDVIHNLFQKASHFFKEAAPSATTGIACNTAHFFFKSFTHNALSIIECCKTRLSELDPPQVILLGTKSTMTSGLYDAAHPKLVIPNETVQDLCHTVIFDEIKAHGQCTPMAKKIANLIISHLKDTYPKDSAIILGCTELPLVFENTDDYFTYIDPQEEFIRNISHAQKS